MSTDDLYTREGILRLDARFLAWLGETSPDLAERLKSGRANPDSLDPKAHSQLLIDAAPLFEDFIAGLFDIRTEVAALRARHADFDPIYEVKRQFVQRKALAKATEAEAAQLDGALVTAQLEALFGEPCTEEAYAAHVTRWLAEEAVYKGELELAARYAVWAAMHPEGKRKHRRADLQTAHKVGPTTWCRWRASARASCPATPPTHRRMRCNFRLDHWRHREGFAPTDQGTAPDPALDQAHYGIKCHNQGKDSARPGSARRRASSRRVRRHPGWMSSRKISEMNRSRSRASRSRRARRHADHRQPDGGRHGPP
ncbi:MAG: hypothetical protein R2762_07115 [Bryobacteraceae bacterium]